MEYLGEEQCKPAPDGGYLDRLVDASRLTLTGLPAYAAAKPLVAHLVSLYSELQAGKHLSPSVRDSLMERWFEARYMVQPSWLSQSHTRWLGRDLHWWEFGAATGSTLAMFALICASGDETLTEEGAQAIAAQYFPAICGLHILLDYYIDQAEDVEGGDLNFVAHYPSAQAAVDALEGFIRWSLSAAQMREERPGLQNAVVRGLLAMYLSDPKVARQGMGEQAARLLRTGGGLTPHLRSACSLLRRLFNF
jgi:tetraprenyl-beta-curcumene synthase